MWNISDLDSVITNDARCTRQIAMAKAAFSRKNTLFASKLYLNLRKKLLKCYIRSIAMYGAETSGSRSKIPGKF
jgi:hypothetical protein